MSESATEEVDQLSRLQRLAQVSHEIMGDLQHLSLEARLNLIAKYATEILQAESCGVFLVKRFGYLSLEASYGHCAGGFDKGRELLIESTPRSGLSGHIAYEGQLFNAHGAELIKHPARNGTRSSHSPSGACYSLLAIPLKSKREGQLVGMLRVDNKKKGHTVDPTIGFSKEDESILQLFANVVVTAIEGAKLVEQLTDKINEQQVDLIEINSANSPVVAFENRRLFQATEQARKRLHAFYKASNALVLSQDPKKVLNDIVEQARIAACADGVSMILIDKMGEVRHLTTTGIDEPLSEGDLVRRNGLSMEVMRTGQICAISNTNDHKERVNPSWFWRKIGAGLCLPLSLRGLRIGVMWFKYRQTQRFSDAELEAVQLYVNQAAMAYHSARRIKELEKMRQAADALARAVSWSDVLRQTVRSACDVLEANSAVICSYDDARGCFLPMNSVAIGAGITPALWQQLQKSKPHYGRTGATVMEQGWVAVHDIKNVLASPVVDQSTYRLLSRINVRSFQGFALRVGDEKLGVLYVNYRQPRHFSDYERQAAQIFANHAALALKKAKLMDQLSVAHKAARVVAQVTVLEEELDYALNSIVEGTKDALNCDAVTLHVYNQNKNQFRSPPIMSGVDYPQHAKRLPYVPKNNIIFDILKREELYIVDRTATNARFKNRRFTVEEGIVSLVAIPLKVGNQRVGVMFVNYRSAHRFTSDELTNLELFSNQAAVAIRNAQLYEGMQRRTQELEMLSEAAKSLTSSLDLSTILNDLALQTQHLFSSSDNNILCFTSIRLIEDTIARQRAFAPMKEIGSTGQVLERAEAISLKIMDLGRMSGRTGIIMRTIESGESQLVGDVSKDPDYIAYNDQTRSELAVPIKNGSDVLGVINVEHPDYYAFDDRDKSVLETLAAQAAIAIENARLFEETQYERDQLKMTKEKLAAKTALLWVGMISTRWEHAIRIHATTIVEEINSLRPSFSSPAPLINAQGIQKKLDKIERLAKKIRDKPITPPLSSEQGVRSVSVNVLFRERLQQLDENYLCQQIECSFEPTMEDKITVRVSPEWLRCAFDILVNNAFNAVRKVPLKQITVRTSLNNKFVMVSVCDSGPGIPNEVRNQLLRLPIKKAKGEKGLGIGLLMAQTIVQAYGGEVQLGSTSSKGTTMIIRLPQEP